MSTLQLSIFIHQDLATEISPFLQSCELEAYQSILNGDAISFFEKEFTELQKNQKYNLLFVPADWFSTFTISSSILTPLIAKGLLRVVFVGHDWERTDFPCTFIPKDCDPVIRKALFSHLLRPSGWGVTTLLSSGAKIYNERISSESQVAKKIEQALSFVLTKQPQRKNRTLALRFAISGCFSEALDSLMAARMKRPATFQMGVDGDLIAFAIRWVDPAKNNDLWKKLSLSWRAVLASASFSVFQFQPDSGEAECLLVFAKDEKSKIAQPLIVDCLKSARTELLNGMKITAGDYVYETWEGLPDTIPVSDGPMFITGGDKTTTPQTHLSAATPEVELESLKTEKQKMENTLATQKEQTSQAQKRLMKAMEAEKLAQQELRSLQVQLNTLQASQASQKQEIETYKKRLEAARQKEMELIKKVTQLVDQLKKKTSSNTESKAG